MFARPGEIPVPNRRVRGTSIGPALRLTAGALMSLLVGCAGRLERDRGETAGPVVVPAPQACATDVAALALLADKCGGCHSGEDAPKGLDLVSAGVAGRLVGVKSSCQGRWLLDPAAAGAGHFIDKLGDAVPGCGQQMPYRLGGLTSGERICLETWARAAIRRVNAVASRDAGGRTARSTSR